MRTVRAIATLGLNALIGLGLSTAAVAAPTQLCVDRSNASCSRTIQDAVNQATKNADITIAAGTYAENVSINPQVGAKAKKVTLTITGAGAGSTIVDGGGITSTFTVGPKTVLTLSAMTIGNSGAQTATGGGVNSSDATLSVVDCVVMNNLGGGLAVSGGSLTVTGSTISNNSGSGIAFTAVTGSKLTVTGSMISGNTAPQGAGLYISNYFKAGKLEIDTSTIRRNTATATAGNGGANVTQKGGGIFLGGTFKRHHLTITNSTINGNSATEGAGLYVEAIGTIQTTQSGFETVDLETSTISNNTAVIQNVPGLTSIAASGAGIFNDGPNTTLTILNSTISGNVAQSNNPSPSAGGGIDNNGPLTLDNVTVANNTASNGGGIDTSSGLEASNSIIADNVGSVSSNDCVGSIDSTGGYNLILDPTGCTFTGKSSTDILGVDPMLRRLTINDGGATKTRALAVGSPALTAGNPATPNKKGSGGKCISTDQVGNKRTKGMCDMGALQESGLTF